MFKKYLLYILAIAAFILGQLSVPDTDKELVRKFAEEKKALLKDIDSLKTSLDALDKRGLTLREKRYTDSLKFSVVIMAKDREIKRLLKRLDHVDTKNYSAAALDSAIRRLYPN